jgi:hypothetical protein
MPPTSALRRVLECTVILQSLSHSIYHFPIRIASMTGCFVFSRRMGVGLDGMTNVALPPRPSGAAVYGPDFGYYQWSFGRPNRAQTHARYYSVSSFLSFFYPLAYLSDFLCGQRM